MDQLFNVGKGSSRQPMPGMSTIQSMLGTDLAGYDPEALQTQAQQIWQILDDMVENDPQRYRQFLQTQAQAAEEEKQKQPFRGAVPPIIVEALLTRTDGRDKPAVIHVWAAQDGEQQ